MAEGEELLPMANECGENCTCSQEEIVEEGAPNYYTIEEFLEGFTDGLREHLSTSILLPRKEHHIEELLLATDIFVDASKAFIFGFITTK